MHQHSSQKFQSARCIRFRLFLISTALLIIIVILTAISFKTSLKKYYVNWLVSAHQPIQGNARYEAMIPPGSIRKSIEEIRRGITSFLRRPQHLFHREIYSALEGNDGWLHLPSALHTANLTQQFYDDAIPAIIDFQKQLSKYGIDLLFVPIPTKWETHPESIVTGITGSPSPNLNVQRATLLNDLVAAGVKVLDLAPHFLKARASSEALLYYREDSHWSPTAAEVAAQAIAARIRSEYPDLPLPQPIRDTYRDHIEIVGNLRTFQQPDTPVSNLPRVTYPARITPTPFTPDLASPIMLIGDSFTFEHLGTALGGTPKNCGLTPQLAIELGFPIDHCARAGGGGEGARRLLAERFRIAPTTMRSKKVVVWVLSSNDFIYGSTGFPFVRMPVADVKETFLAFNQPIQATCLASTDFDPKARHAYRDAVVGYLFEHEGQPFHFSRIELDDARPVPDLVPFVPGKNYMVSILSWEKAVDQNVKLRTIMMVDTTGDFTAPRYLIIPRTSNTKD